MRALLSFIVSTTSFASSLWAGVAAAAEPFNWSPQVDDPIHTPAELVESVPTIPDNDPMANPRGMAIRFELPGGASTDVAAHSFNGFPVSDTDDLRELMLAIAASGLCAATPTALDRFFEFHPTARAFLATQKTPASFATISYYGVGSFKFINVKGEAHYVRYQVVSEAGEQLLTDEERKKQSANYLMDEIKARVAAAPIGFALYAQVAEHGDRINDPSIAWPDNRKRVSSWQTRNQEANSKHSRRGQKLVFNPSNVPSGIETADMLSSSYSKAFRLSAEEARDVAPVARN